MLIDNSAQTGQLNVLGIGTSQGGGAPTPVGDFYLTTGGKLLLLVTEDTLLGAMCGRLWHCRTYNRPELRLACEGCGLHWEREMWFSRLHQMLKLGGIIVELRRLPGPKSG